LFLVLSGICRDSLQAFVLFHLLLCHCCLSSALFCLDFAMLFMLCTCHHVTTFSLYDYCFHYLTRPPRIINCCLTNRDVSCLHSGVLWFSEKTPCKCLRRNQKQRLDASFSHYVSIVLH
jgi:hypothetical protein